MHVFNNKDEFMPVLLDPGLTKTIINVPPYRRGEFFWSYLNRLASNNGFDDAIEYMSVIFKRDILDSNCNNVIFGAVTDEYGKPIAESSIFRILKFFLDHDDLARLYKMYQNTGTRMNSSIGDMVYPSRIMKLCPECYKEDIVDGNPFVYRTIHQVPGLNICPKHGCHLVQYKGTIGKEYCHPDFVALDTNDSDIIIADIVKALWETDRTFCVTDIKKALAKRVFAHYRSDRPIEIYKKFAVDEGIDVSVRENRERFLRLFSTRESYSNVAYMLKVLARFFKSGEDLLNAIPDYRLADEDVFRYVIDGKYELLTPYSQEAIKLKCLNCKYEFWTTHYEMFNEKGCKACKYNALFKDYDDKWEQIDEAFESLISSINHDFKLIKVNHGQAMILHKPCGHVFSMDAREFLSNIKCPACKGRKNKQMKKVSFDSVPFVTEKLTIDNAVPVCDSLLYKLGLIEEPGESSVAIYRDDFINEPIMRKQVEKYGNIFAMRGTYDDKFLLEYAFVDTLLHSSYVTDFPEEKVYELAYWMKSHGVTEESLKQLNMPVYTSYINEAVRLMERV